MVGEKVNEVGYCNCAKANRTRLSSYFLYILYRNSSMIRIAAGPVMGRHSLIYWCSVSSLF